MLSTGERVNESGAISALKTYIGWWRTQTLGKLWRMWRVLGRSSENPGDGQLGPELRWAFGEFLPEEAALGWGPEG